MQKQFAQLIILFFILTIINCGIMRPKWKSVIINKQESEAADLLSIQHNDLKKLKSKPLYEFTPQDLDVYLGYLQTVEPDLRKRVQQSNLSIGRIPI